MTDLRERLAAYVAELRERAAAAGPQAYAFTYRHVADEIEARFLKDVWAQGIRKVYRDEYRANL